jgi:hypothetical protein
MRQAGQNRQNKTARTGLQAQGCAGLPGQDCRDTTARPGQKGEDDQKRTARTQHLEGECQNGIDRMGMGQPEEWKTEKGKQNRTASTGLLG